jgi:hypothetical protein
VKEAGALEQLGLAFPAAELMVGLRLCLIPVFTGDPVGITKLKSFDLSFMSETVVHKLQQEKESMVQETRLLRTLEMVKAGSEDCLIGLEAEPTCFCPARIW